MMKKVFMVMVAGTLVLSSCGNKKDFCECVTESMASEDPNAYPEGCEYIKDMDEAEVASKSTECLGDIFGALGDALGEGMEDLGAEMDAALEAAVDSLGAAADSVAVEMEEATEM
jgi:hypothetical protein